MNYVNSGQFTIPVMSVENFYENPKEIREFALSQKYQKSIDGRWPGKRTEQLYELDVELFNSFCQRLFSLIFDYSVSSVNWEVNTSFQLIEPVNSPRNKGWIHTDEGILFAGVIYLDEDPDIDAGTTIYNPKHPILLDDYIKWSDCKVDYELEDKDINYNNTLVEHYNYFDEAVTVKNKFNRLVLFDANQWHAASFSQTKQRLTQAFFVECVESHSPPPIVRLNSL